MEANRTASPSTPPPPWAVRRTAGPADSRSTALRHSRTARPPDRLTALLNPDLKLVSRDECRTSCGKPDGHLRHAQTRELRHDEGQQAVLDFEHARCQRVGGVVRPDR